jgi:transcriptional regulator with XRE-family HTH domain
MIKTDRQLKHTVREIGRFEEAAESHVDGPSRDALLSVLDDLRQSVAEYEALKRGDLSKAKSTSVYGLPEVIIKTRIARGLSQSDLAEMLGAKPQQVQRWEADDYESINSARLLEIADILGVRMHSTASGAVVTSNILPFHGSMNFIASGVFKWDGLILTQGKLAELASGCGSIKARIHDTPTAPVIHVEDGEGRTGGTYIRVATEQQRAANLDNSVNVELKFA